MKRFFHFLLFVALLCIAVGSLQLWKERREGSTGRWTQTLHDVFNGRPLARSHPEKYTLADGPRIDLKDVNVLAAMSRQRIALAQTVVPSVVSITTSRTVQVPDFQNDPFYQFFHRNQRQNNERTENQLGSGAIVSKEGHIVTNNHVIEGMDEIEVKLSDGRQRVARLIGTDLDTDIAVLKIDDANVVPLPFGNSDGVEVGETVMAVGNPYGLEESVTQGIISAKNRPGNENGSELFQIDAAINPGNSGGPLVNVRGELIGINEAIFSKSGGWQGVGFAIPAAAVRRTMDGILHTGRVIHSYLGIRPARAGGPGVLVASVVAGSPAEKVDIHPGDTIRSFNGKPVDDFAALHRLVAQVDVDVTVPVELVREGKPVSVQARIAERPPQQAQLSQVPHLPPGHPPIGPRSGGGSLTPGTGGPLNFLRVRELSAQDLRTLDLSQNTRGVLVAGVEPDSNTEDKIQLGDLIETINQQPVGSMTEYSSIIRSLPADEPVVVALVRNRTRTMVVIVPG